MSGDHLHQVVAEDLVAPITALSFVSSSLLLAGEGPNLHMYDIRDCTKQIASLKVLKSANIHGIRQLEDCAFRDDGENSGRVLLCVYGGKCAQIVQYKSSDKLIQLAFEGREFEDWIWDICPLSISVEVNKPTGEGQGAAFKNRKSCKSLAVALSHNSVLNWDYRENVILHHVDCEEKCILYSAKFIGQSWDELILAAGTVFNQVILWKVKGHVNEGGRVKVTHRLSGHQGVIFSIAYHPGKQLICSVSDDRSIRLWRLKQPVSGEHSLTDWEHAVFDPLHVLYGHSARVWDVRLLEDYIVSVGEDATTCLWDYQGQIVQKFRGHKGKSIWSVAVDEEETVVATGGGDTSIRLWSLSEKSSSETTSEVTLNIPQVSAPCSKESKDSAPDFPRVVRLQDDTTVLVMTNTGCLFSHSLTYRTWTRIWQRDDFQSYSLLEVCQHGRLIAIGNMSGWLVVLAPDQDCHTERKLYDGKVFSIQWLNDAQLLTTGPEGQLDVWQLTRCGLDEAQLLCLTPASKHTLPHSRQRWVSAVASLSVGYDLLVCGDRGGTVHVYDTQSQALEPIKSFVKLHGKTGVTDICYHDDHIYTCGRNGLLGQFSVEDRNLHLMTSKKVFKGFEWLGRLVFVDNSLLVLGFHNDKFIVYNTYSDQVIFSSPCGGGHRTWDFSLDPVADLCRFVCIKSGDVRLCEAAVSTRHIVLKPSLHGRELTDVQHLFTGLSEDGRLNQQILATASEDTFINLVSFSSTENSTRQFKVITSLQGHLSSVRALAACAETPNSGLANSSSGENSFQQPNCCSKLLFSGGGRAQLKAWRVRFQRRHANADKTVSSKMADKGWTCKTEHLANHMLCMKGLKQRKPWKKEQYNPSSETRYMSLSAFSMTEFSTEIPGHLYVVAAACSDGFVRVFRFDTETCSFHMLALSDYHNHCVLCVKHLVTQKPTNQKQAFIVSAATDGEVAFWDISEILLAHRRSVTKENVTDEESCNVTEDSSDGTQLLNCSVASAKNASVVMDTHNLKQPSAVLKVHQSGINSLDIFHVHDSQYLLSTGGDDNALCVQLIDIKSIAVTDLGQSPGVSEVWKAVKDTAHAAQITGVQILSREVLVTASIDQRVILWRLNWEPVPQLDVLGSRFVNLADVSSMSCWKDRSDETTHLALSGVGLQLVTVNPAVPAVL